jgi:hypothetical protein
MNINALVRKTSEAIRSNYCSIIRVFSVEIPSTVNRRKRVRDIPLFDIDPFLARMGE